MPSEESIKKAREIAVRVHASTNYSCLSEVAEEIIAEALDEAKAGRAEECAEIAALYIINGGSIHPDLKSDQISDQAKMIANTTCQHVAHAIREKFPLTKGPSQ